MSIIVEKNSISSCSYEGIICSNNKVEIPKGKEIVEPINIEIIDNSELVIDVNELSKAYIVDINNSLDSKITVNIKRNAHLEYLAFDYKASKISRIFNLYRDAYLEGTLGHFNDQKAKIEDCLFLKENNAYAIVDIVAMSDQEYSQIVEAKVEHEAPFTTGILNNYGVAKDKGVTIFNGFNHIAKGMNGSDSKQKTRGMILSNKALVEANPSLLIDEYDVSANHGATIGKISDEGLYYLMSRGISKEEAIKLIINGFLTPIIEKIKLEDAKEAFKNIATKKI